VIRLLFLFLAFALPVAGQAPDEVSRKILAPLLDPAKVDTLQGKRAINGRFLRVLYWVRQAGNPGAVIDAAQAAAGYGGNRASADRTAILRSLEKLEKLGLEPAEWEKMRAGKSPTITRGKHAGDIVEVDHVLPVAVVPELAAKFFNLEVMPQKENRAKGDTITARGAELARRWHRMGLLSDAGLRAASR
jgi:hypothetical protein